MSHQIQGHTRYICLIFMLEVVIRSSLIFSMHHYLYKRGNVKIVMFSCHLSCVFVVKVVLILVSIYVYDLVNGFIPI